jgi:uncharacterized membrane protein YsdA (DUF1294 family)
MTQYNATLIAGGYFAISFMTLVFYGIDKYRAKHGQWRISERTLHGLELLGGWPGALLAQFLFHHKRRKLSFMLVCVTIIALHVAIWIMVFRLME